MPRMTILLITTSVGLVKVSVCAAGSLVMVLYETGQFQLYCSASTPGYLGSRKKSFRRGKDIPAARKSSLYEDAIKARTA